MLFLQNGEAFATGVIGYEFRSVTPTYEHNQRILLSVYIDDFPVLAAIDTGAPYLIITPSLAARFGLEPSAALEKAHITIRGIKFSGTLFRLDVRLDAQEGEGLIFQATAFAPDLDQEDKWGNLPCFLGIESCLDRIRFAIDPHPVEPRFYFGVLP